MLNGKDGSIMWENKVETIQLFSDISLRTIEGGDVFLARAIGGYNAKARTTHRQVHLSYKQCFMLHILLASEEI